MGSQKAKKKVAYKIKFGDCETPQHHTFKAEEHRPVAKTHLSFICMQLISWTGSHHFREMIQVSDYLLKNIYHFISLHY